MGLAPSERKLRAKLAAHQLHAQHDSRVLTTNGRAKFLQRFEDEVDPNRELPEAERLRRAEHARKAYFTKLAFESAKGPSEAEGGGVSTWTSSDAKKLPSYRTAWMSALRDSDVTPCALFVGLLLGTWMSADDGYCFPNLDTLCAKAHVGKRTILRALAELKESGWLTWARGGGEGNPNRYQARIPKGVTTAPQWRQEMNKVAKWDRNVVTGDAESGHSWTPGSYQEVPIHKSKELDGEEEQEDRTPLTYPTGAKSFGEHLQRLAAERKGKVANESSGDESAD